MLEKVKKFAEKHRGKIIGGVVTATGIIIAYNCGTHQIIGRLRGNCYETLLTNNRNWCNCVHRFLETSNGRIAFRVNTYIPREELVDFITKATEQLPEEFDKVNVLMTAIPKE